MDKLAIIIPVFNEEEIISKSIKEFLKLLNNMIKKKIVSKDSLLVFIDDGSSDKTLKILSEFSMKYNSIVTIKLSRNFGQQNAILAGLFNINADMYITVDVDLQEDINAIPLMVNKYLDGADIVYGVRKSRKKDTFFKKFTAESFYKLMIIMGINIIPNHSEYRLLSKRVVKALQKFPERNLFLKGIIPSIGYNSSQVYYERNARIGGSTKYSVKKLFSLAWEGITSFSTVPLKLITLIGFIVFLLSLILSLWALYMKLFTNSAVPGWASTVIPIYFIGGIQILSIGILGEYMGKIYKETKRRPKFFIDKVIKKDN